jgi:hypothetical protein
VQGSFGLRLPFLLNPDNTSPLRGEVLSGYKKQVTGRRRVELKKKKERNTKYQKKMEHKGVIGKSPRQLEQFFTKDCIVTMCLERLGSLTKYKLIVEPSAGDLAFVRQIPPAAPLHYMDIDSSDESHRCDFLTWVPPAPPPQLLPRSPMIVLFV